MAVAASKERSSHSISDTFDNNKRVIVYSDTDWGGVTAEGKQLNLWILACRVFGTTQKSNPNLHLARPDRLNCVVVCFCADNSEMPSSPPPPLSLFLSFYLFFCGMMMSYGSLMYVCVCTPTCKGTKTRSFTRPRSRCVLVCVPPYNFPICSFQ